MTSPTGLPVTRSLPASRQLPDQYSLRKILLIWATVTAPMAILAFVVAPAVMPRTALHPGLVYWILMVVGMVWQFVVSVAILRRELGGLHWPAVKERIWFTGPRDPRTGEPRRRLWWWAVPAIAANALGSLAATQLDALWTDWLPALREPFAHPDRGFGRPAVPGAVVDPRAGPDEPCVQLPAR